MTTREQGFLLLTSSLGDPQRKSLSLHQFRTLILRSKKYPKLRNASTVTLEDMAAMGYDRKMAERVVHLFSQREQMMGYVKAGARQGCSFVGLTNPDYPIRLAYRLDMDTPTVLWTKGDKTLLQKPAIALVGSREGREENIEFAHEVGRLAAKLGYVLVSGNARGADRTAQNACLAAGGQVISVVADRLTEQTGDKNVLYISEDGFDLPFSSRRALLRNRIIHALGEKTFVAQSEYGRGGTWDGTVKNLRHGWSPVYCFHDGSRAAAEFGAMGAGLITIKEIKTAIETQRKGESFI